MSLAAAPLKVMCKANLQLTLQANYSCVWMQQWWGSLCMSTIQAPTPMRTTHLFWVRTVYAPQKMAAY